MRGFNYKKSVQALNCFAVNSKEGILNNMKAIKLVWLSDRLHLRTYGRTITGDVYFAMPYGPVASTTLDLIADNPYLSEVETHYKIQFLAAVGEYHFKSIAEPNLKVFSQTDRDTLDKIYKSYSHLNEFELSNLSHSFPEWRKYKDALENKTASRFQIDPTEFFENFKDLSNLFVSTNEELDNSKEIFQEHQNLELAC